MPSISNLTAVSSVNTTDLIPVVQTPAGANNPKKATVAQLATTLLASPTLTGTPIAPTAAVDTSTTQLATTEYVVNQLYLKTAVASATYALLAGSAGQNFSANTLTATTVNTTSVNATTYNGGSTLGFRNKIRNGKMDIAQRGTSFAALGAVTQYTVDGWVWSASSTTGVVTVTQQADAPTDNEFQNSLRVTVTTGDAAVAAGDLAYVYQPIEGYLVRDLNGQPIAISFRVKSSVTGTYCVSLRNSIADRSYVTTYTVISANTWETKTISISSGLITAGTWNWTNGLGLSLGFALMAGSTYQTTAGAWQTGNFFATSAQANAIATAGNVFAITGVQLEKGTASSPYEHLDPVSELQRQQRYLPVIDTNKGQGDVGMGVAISVSQAVVPIPLPVETRTVITGLTVTNIGSFTATSASSSAVVTSLVFGSNSSARMVRVTVGVGTTPWAVHQPVITYGTSANGLIVFTGAEL